MNTAQLELNNRLLAAAKVGDAAELRRLLDAGASALARDEGSASECALIHASRTGSLDCVRLLLEHGANVNSTNFYTTPLMAACRNGHVEVARYLVEQAGADVNQDECEDLTALNYAAYSGSIELVDLLLDHGADIDNETWEGTALARVCRDGDERMGLHLLARGADPLRDPETLAGACEGGSLKLVQAVLEAWKKSGRDYVRELREDSPMEAAVVGADTFNPEVAQLMYAHGFRFDGMLGESGWWNRHGECDADGERLRWLRAHGAFDGPPKPLPDVARECQSVVDAAEQGKDALLHMNADIETRNEDGCTPFLLACKKGMPAAAKRLADMGCDTAAVDAAGNTALILAATCPGAPSPGRVRCCASLILWLAELGVDVNARNHRGETALLRAWETEIAMLLLELGARADVVSHSGCTAMHRHSDPVVLQRLLELGCPLDRVTDSGEHAIEKYNAEAIRFFLQHGVNPNIPHAHAFLVWLVTSWNVEAVDALVRAGMDANTRDRHDLATPLHEVCRANDKRLPASADILRLLLGAGADVNARDECLQTPLMKLCLQSGDDEATTEMVRILLQHGADPSLEDVHGETALDIARDGELTDIVELLENAETQPNTKS